jgi:hypothetical protein
LAELSVDFVLKRGHDAVAPPHPNDGNAPPLRR